MSNDTTVTLNINSNGMSGVRITPEYANTDKFSMTKQFIMKETKNQEDMDVFEYMNIMSKGARELFILIKRKASYKTNRAVLDTTDLTKLEQNNRSRNYTELRKLNIVRRVKQNQITTLTDEPIQVPNGTFMINPDLIRPGKRYSEEIFLQWRQLG